MGIDRKYGWVSVGKDSPEHPINGTEEPVFVLRAQDRNALAAIEDYRAHAVGTGATADFLHGLEDVEAAFLQWQGKNPGLTKIPD